VAAPPDDATTTSGSVTVMKTALRTYIRSLRTAIDVGRDQA